MEAIQIKCLCTQQPAASTSSTWTAAMPNNEEWTSPSFYLKVKAKKQSHYRPDRPWGFQKVEALRFQDNRHMKVVRLSALRTGHPYPQEIFLVLTSIRGWVDPRAIVQPTGLYEWKTPVAPSGIKPATFRLVAQCLDQLRHRVTLLFTCRQIQSDSETSPYNAVLKSDNGQSSRGAQQQGQ
jgi:hypothetical protein